MPFSNGTLIDDTGAVQAVSVAITYVPVAGDVWINGTLHRGSDGAMYVAVTGTATVPINGILHSPNGVRRGVFASRVVNWPEGFSVNGSGVQSFETDPAAVSYIRGIARNSLDGAMDMDLIA